MKKYIMPVFLVLCLSIVQGKSQYAVSWGRNAYRAADELVKQQVEYKDPGLTGRGLIWDFSILQSVNEEYSLQYFIPDSAYMNRLCGQEHNTRYYYRQESDSLWATGFENATTYMTYTEPELKLRFPLVYGDTLFSRFKGNGMYCHRLALQVEGYTRVMADAEGDLILPDDEQIKKAMRVHTLRHYTQTGKDSVEMILDSYAWYAKGIRYPVFESIRTTLSHKGDNNPDDAGEGLRDTVVFNTSFYYPPTLQKSQVQTDSISDDVQPDENEITKVFTEGQFMPNPVINDLNISYKLTRPAKVWFSLHNNIGIPQYISQPENQPEGYYNTSISMGSLIVGTYSLYVHVDDMVMKQVIVKK